MTTPIWIPQAQRLKPFDGKLLPATIGANKTKKLLIRGAIKDQYFSVNRCLNTPQLKMIGLKTSLDFICIDIDGEKGHKLAYEKGFDWPKHHSWFIGRSGNAERFKIIYRRTPDQQKFGPIHQVDNVNEIDIFSSSTSWVAVLGDHPDGDLYCWFKKGPEKLIDCPESVWEFVVGHITDYKQRHLITTTTAKTPTPRGTWQPAIPCPICGRTKDNDCSVSKDGTFVQCHLGKTNHPPSLKVGETIRLVGVDWAFCGLGTNAIGQFSKFKINVNTPTPWDIIYGNGK